MAEFVGLSAEERQLVRATAPQLLKRADELTAAIYDHFLKFPQTAKFFLTETGEVDQERIDRRKHSLARWLLGAIDFNIEEDFPVFLLAMGLVHSHPGTHREHLGSVPSRFMIGTMSFVQTAITKLLLEDMEDREQAVRAAVAWNKQLMVQLDVLLAGYVTERPI